ncbi:MULTISPECIES: DUF4440 domain-containing protein [unclassified Pseudomonas]|uniref:DUF4440 domain-containing protein n=1 Tax=unclassified Pseudomonas TaxID=196821 RepID=UPI00165EA656|nr:DUF4440 domain-containing protein [Pseudomonas sp. EZ-C24]
MNRPRLYLSVAFLCLPAYATAATKECQPVADDDVLSLFSQWNASLQSGDPAAVARLYAVDALLLPTVSSLPRLSTAERVDYFKHFLADRPSGRLDSHHVSIGCNQASLAGLYTFDFAATGKQVAARYTFTYDWTGSEWLISHHHSSLLPAD